MNFTISGLCSARNFRNGVLLLAIAVFIDMSVVNAADWPTYRGNIARSGSTTESINSDLHLQWTYVPTHAPVPAWPVPAEEMPRNHSDNAYHACIADGSVYFGSSVTNEVMCLDIASGSRKWSFYAQGPVRFAPTVYEGKVYFGSDDGYAYCLDAKDGNQIWNYRAGVSGEKVIGNGRMISLWPVRTSVLVDNGEVFFAAGVFPYEGLYICALNAVSGEVIWKNDTIGDRSHELQFGGISPAGYLLASKSMIYVPSGRSLPVAFDRKTG
jgi:outer membrane protein assembly factor BamB